MTKKNWVRKFGSQRVKCFEICDFSQHVGIFTRTFSAQTVWNGIILNTLSVKSKQPPCRNYTLKLSIIMHKLYDQPIKITTRFLGSDVLDCIMNSERLFGSWPWEPGHDLKSGWEFRLTICIAVVNLYCTFKLTDSSNNKGNALMIDCSYLGSSPFSTGVSSSSLNCSAFLTFSKHEVAGFRETLSYL